MIPAAMGLLISLLLALLVVGGSVIGIPLYQEQQASSSRAAFDGLVVRAQALAPSTGDGATIAVVNGQGSWTASLYQGRPDPQHGLGALVGRVAGAGTLTLQGTSSFGLFVDSAGHLVAQPSWSIGTIIQTEPTCAGQIDVTETFGPQSLDSVYSC